MERPAAEAQPANTVQFDIIKESVLTLLPTTEEKWQRMLLTSQGSRSDLAAFLDVEQEHVILFYEATPNELTACLPRNRSKGTKQPTALYFLKANASKITSSADVSTLGFGKLQLNSVEMFHSVLEEIYRPVIFENDKLANLPNNVALDLQRSLQTAVLTSQSLAQNQSGKPLLHMPSRPTATTGTSAHPSDLSNTLVLETSVAEWVKIIKEVLSRSPDSIISQWETLAMDDPSPKWELQFWTEHLQNLEFLQSQLSQEHVLSCIEALSSMHHPSANHMQTLKAEVEAVTKGARSIYLHLIPLQDTMDRLLSPLEFDSLGDLWHHLIPMVSLVAENCDYYTSFQNVLRLLGQIVALFLYQAHQHLQADSVITEDPAEVQKRIAIIRKVAFGLETSISRSVTTWKGWNLDCSALLEPLSSFSQHLAKLDRLIQSISDYARLDKLDLGGILSQGIQVEWDEIAAEFKAAFASLSQEPKDVVKDSSFKDDATRFEFVITGLDHRLGVIGSQALIQASDIATKTKMMQVIGPFVARDAVAIELHDQCKVMIEEWKAELEQIGHCVKETSSISNAMHWNIPPTAAAFQNLISFRRQMDTTAESLSIVAYNWSASSDLALEAKQALELKDRVVSQLDKSEQVLQEHWSRTLVEKATQNLRIPFLARIGPKTLSVNFDERVQELLRDVRHLESWHLNVPPKAKKIFGQMQAFQTRVQLLQEGVLLYNTTLSKLMPIEEALLGVRIRALDNLIDSSLRTHTWESLDTDSKIQEILNGVRSLSQLADNAKDKWSSMQQISASWCSDPWILRPAASSTIDFDRADETLVALAGRIRTEGKQIHSIMEEIRTGLSIDTLTEKWFNYRKAVDAMVSEALRTGIRKTLALFLAVMKPPGGRSSEENAAPLVKVVLDLDMDDVGAALVYKPPLANDDIESVKLMFLRLIDDLFGVTSEIERIAPHSVTTGLHNLSLTSPGGEKGEFLQVDISEPDVQSYRGEILLNMELQSMKEEITQQLKKAIAGSEGCQSDFEPFDFLWAPIATDENQQPASDESADGRQERDIGAQGSSDPTKALPTDDHTTVIPYSWPKVEIAASETESRLQELDSIVTILDSLPTERIFEDWFAVDCDPAKRKLLALVQARKQVLSQDMRKRLTEGVAAISQFINTAQLHLKTDVHDDRSKLIDTKSLLETISNHETEFRDVAEAFRRASEVLEKSGCGAAADVSQGALVQLDGRWEQTLEQAEITKAKIAPLQSAMADELRSTCSVLEGDIRSYKMNFKETAPFSYAAGVTSALSALAEKEAKLAEMHDSAQQMIKVANLFGVTCSALKQVAELRRECGLLTSIWQFADKVHNKFKEWYECKWNDLQTDVLENTCQDFMKEMRKMDREIKSWNVFSGLDKEIKEMMTQLQVAVELRSPNIRERHWNQLLENSATKLDTSGIWRMQEIIALNLDLELVRSVADRAAKEVQVEKHLETIRKTWESAEFTVRSSNVVSDALMLVGSDLLIETLEDNQVLLQNMMANKHVQFFQPQIMKWQETLGNMDNALHVLLDVQQSWSHLVSIFLGSEDIKAQLPEDTIQFAKVNETFQELMRDLQKDPGCLRFCAISGIAKKLEDACLVLNMCERSLSQYLNKKRQVFPRFYFVSRADLLDILSKGAVPTAVCKHLPKLFDSIAELKFAVDASGAATKLAVGMFSKENEYIPFCEPLDCTGQVEQWLNRLVETMRKTLHQLLSEAVTTYQEKPREQWLFDYPAQIVLAATQIWWNTEVNLAFVKLEEGYDGAMKEYHRKQCNQITSLIQLIQGNLSPLDRTKIMTVCTLDVHARDVITKLVAEKADSSQCFSWLSQLRLMWDDERGDCFASIADASFRYNYEYLGCTPRLVVTPLTDRCYITLTQALHLYMGGAPAGPAGTGKTETTKDLGRALGCMVYVFNCSEQMDYKSIGNIYRGLVQEGAWGCFDEFNRIPVDVLSVIGTQVKSIQDALRGKKTVFTLEGEETRLNPNVGIFITMNPGYAGRTELPENIKALFRPCSMVVPDLQLICEIMLMAEGFVEATVLAQKFTTLYKLCRELLSQQDHYDWGLRAIKSVLVVAGSLKRADPEMPESHILMRSLRDFNVPKIVTGDLPIFLGLIHDLFPNVEVARKKIATLEDAIRKAAADAGLQADDNFVLKVVQLEELMAVRHSVFIIGPPGSGKTQVWKTLSRAKALLGKKCLTADLDPKAVSTDELYGCIHPTTREWKDGLFSSLLRDMVSANADHKWLVLDGDIDPNWIESLNTVMDDNKVLTLASNERIPLQPNMRLIFEICDLKNATPATVSRAGILYLNATDIGWTPLLQTWLDGCEDVSERTVLSSCFEKYLPTCLDYVANTKSKALHVESINLVSTLCDMLRGLFANAKIQKGSDREVYETYFCFALIWVIGGVFASNGDADGRLEFSNWWHASALKQISTVPTTGSVFDYYVDNATRTWKPWSAAMPQEGSDIEVPFSSLFEPTTDSVALSYLMDTLLAVGKSILLVGNAGCGKTLTARTKLNECVDSNKFEGQMINMTFYTTGPSLQGQLEKHLEKKAGRTYGPKGGMKLLYFLDDLNMPEVDKYGTVECHALLRQHLDHGHWYDRNKLSLKDISNCQYIACMNPHVGSFTVTPRLQRHFATFAVPKPSSEAMQRIYAGALQARLPAIGPDLASALPIMVAATLSLHGRVQKTFQATAAKPHYLFNMHDLASVFQGICLIAKDSIKTPQDMSRLWVHEVARSYCDKLATQEDLLQFEKILQETLQAHFSDQESSLKSPIIFGWALKGGDAGYKCSDSWDQLRSTLQEQQEQYNEGHAAQNLILFEDAVSHAFRVTRTLRMPDQHVLLVGVGGSGKQSLARLGAYMAGMETFQITPGPNYNVTEMKNDLAALFIKAGQKKQQVVLVLPDGHIADERLLIPINEYLCTGDISGLYADDALDSIMSAMRVEAKAQGLGDSKKVCWDLFLKNVAANFKIIMCFSPIGSKLKLRLQRYPGILSRAKMDWFHEWPMTALKTVAHGLLSSSEHLPEHLVASTADFMGFAHVSIGQTAKDLFRDEHRHVYTTPKSFLSYVQLYKKMLEVRKAMVASNMERLSKGLQKLQITGEQVEELKIKLAAQDIELAAKNEVAEKLIQKVALDTEKVNSQKMIADEEERKVNQITREVSERQAQCEGDLKAAEPALEAAAKALNTLNKANLTELKSFGSPTVDIINVAAAVMVLLSPPGKIAKDRSWKAGKNMMAKVDQFLDSLIHFKKESIDQSNLDAVQVYLADPNFNEEYIGSKSIAAAGLCSWVVNIVKYYKVFREVEPKRLALEAANAELKNSQAKLAAVQAHVAELDANLLVLKQQFEMATQEKLECTRAAKETADTISLANRLVVGLASEKTRWSQEYGKNEEELKTLPADVLVAASFVAYAGPFPKKYREQLTSDWIARLREPSTTSATPIADPSQKENLATPLFLSPAFNLSTMLTTSMEQAIWNNEGLPTDQTSLENAVIITKATRWPLIVDPQLQAINWIKNRDPNIQVVQLNNPNFMGVLTNSISSGHAVLLEDVGEWIDPILEPLLSQSTTRGGRFIKLGDKEFEYDPKFRLILQSRLSNPNYPPEIQAQTALVNFSVTIDGLEDQLLADVVRSERPDLEESKRQLTKSQNEFKVKLLELEDSLLEKLSAAQGDFLKDTSLVESLETTKATASAIESQVKEALQTEKTINTARESYRPVARRSAQIYFLLNDLWKINPMYQYSLFSFKRVFSRAIALTPPAADLEERIGKLMDTITNLVFTTVNRGLFERDKLTMITQLTFLVHATSVEAEASSATNRNPSTGATDGSPIPALPADEVQFVLRGPPAIESAAQSSTYRGSSALDWLNDTVLAAVKHLSQKDAFKSLLSDMENSSKQWRKYCELEAPELEKMPQDWKNKTPLQKLCVLRCLRPDRMIIAVRQFVGQLMGAAFVDQPRQPLVTILTNEVDKSTPVFFILSPGVDPLKDVEAAGRQIGFTQDSGTLSVVSLGQGQEARAEQCLLEASKRGTWVMLQNIHLVAKWLPKLAVNLEKISSSAHENFRIFLSAEPAADPEFHVIPSSLLQRSIKITNEPPTGMNANLHRALDSFEPGSLERSSKDMEYRALMFALFFFHSVVLERRKFGVQGWNKPYPFTTGDLTISGEVLYNYLENYSKIPWIDLRYIIGDIMYGGHISDYWDRRLCTTYLETFMPDEQMFERTFELAANFPIPMGQLESKDYHAYIDSQLPTEAPTLYRMHANAEIEVLTKMSDYLFRCLVAGQSNTSSKATGPSQGLEDDKQNNVVDDMLERLPEPFNMTELFHKAEERTPFTNVALQECELMNKLLIEMSKLLKELSKGLKGSLTLSPAMEAHLQSIANNEVPKIWVKYSYPSQHPLATWFADVLLRFKQLESWTADFQVPHSLWLGGLFSPQSFLTAIMQTTARKLDMPIDKLALAVEVTKKNREEIANPPRDGAYVHGLRIEGARWDTALGSLQDAVLKDLRPYLPVLHIKAVPIERKDVRGTYECPLYRTKIRGPTFVCPIQLKTKDKPSKWILTGTALFLE